MKKKLLFDFLPTSIVFLLVSTIWVIFNVSTSEIFLLLTGLLLGHLFLDLDHLLYWFWRKPNTEESRLVKTTFEKKEIKEIVKLIKAAGSSHNNLIFHHYFFQISLNLISFFIFISFSNIFILSFLLAINLHLLTDEINDYFYNPKFLQKWLFAREDKQLPIKSLKNYLIIFSVLFLFFLYILIKVKV